MELLTESVGLHFRPSEVKNYVNNQLEHGDELELEREPSNQYDSNAIKVLASGIHIGYVPKIDNSVLAALMDAGDCENLFAEVFSLSSKNPRILIRWDD